MHESLSSTPEQAPPYFDPPTMLSMIEGENSQACRQLYEDRKDKFLAASGSSHNHQFWPGGYIDHVTDAMNVGLSVYDLYNSRRPLRFSRSDVLLVVYLHDLEKPFKYTYGEDGTITEDARFPGKASGEAFKRELITTYGIQLTDVQDNALEFAEGVRDSKFQRGRRVMSELAVLCHIADLTSARLRYNYPLVDGDTWTGARRQNKNAAGVVLPTEFPLDT